MKTYFKRNLCTNEVISTFKSCNYIFLYEIVYFHLVSIKFKNVVEMLLICLNPTVTSLNYFSFIWTQFTFKTHQN